MNTQNVITSIDGIKGIKQAQSQKNKGRLNDDVTSKDLRTDNNNNNKKKRNK